MKINNSRNTIPALLGIIGLLTLAALPVGAVEAPTRSDFVGVWKGALAVGQYRLRIIINVRESQDGELEAAIDSPDQGATDIPVAEVAVDGASIHFDIQVISAVYEGRLNERRKAIEGEWRQSGQVLPLKVERSAPEQQAR